MPQVIVYPDVLNGVLDFLRLKLATRPEAYAQGATTGSYLPSPRPDLPFIWARRVGGFTTGRATDRARIDLHVYHEDEAQAHDLTQLVRGLILAWPEFDSSIAKGAREFSGPGPVVDDLWPDAVRFYFTVEIYLRGLVA